MTAAAPIFGAAALLAAALAVAFLQRRQLQAARAATIDAARRTQAVFDSTIDALLILDPGGTVAQVNAAAGELLGYAADDLAGRDVSVILDIAPETGSLAQRFGLVEGRLRQPFRADCRAFRRDGRAIAVDAALHLMDLASGPHVIVSLREVSERERSERMRDDALLQVSHALQTPLATVATSLELLNAGGLDRLPADAARLVETADRTCRQLVRLVADLLDQDRHELGEGGGARIPFDLRQAMAAAARPAAPAGGAAPAIEAARYS